jgi:hypothetical protein
MVRSADVHRCPRALGLEHNDIAAIGSMVTLEAGPAESDALDFGRRPPPQVEIVHEISPSGYEVAIRVDCRDPIEG